MGQADVWSDIPLTPMPPSRGIWWPRVVWTWVHLTWAHVLSSVVFNRPPWIFKSTPSSPVQASNAQEWYYCRSAWHLVRLWVRLMFGQMYPHPSPLCPLNAPPPPQYRHAVAKSSTTSGQLDIWSAFGSGWPVYVRVNLVPAAMVIPAPWVDIKVVAVKKLICYCLQFSIDHLEFWWVHPVCNILSSVFKSMSSVVWNSAHFYNISQNIHS